MAIEGFWLMNQQWLRKSIKQASQPYILLYNCKACQTRAKLLLALCSVIGNAGSVSAISSNGTGVLRLAGGIARLSNSDIAFNITGKSGGSPGLISFGNNRLSANGADGDAFTTETQE